MTQHQPTLTQPRLPAEALGSFLEKEERDLKWLSRHTGWSYTHLWRVLNEGRAISPDLAAKLAELFNVPASTFLPDEGGEG